MHRSATTAVPGRTNVRVWAGSRQEKAQYRCLARGVHGGALAPGLGGGTVVDTACANSYSGLGVLLHRPSVPRYPLPSSAPRSLFLLAVLVACGGSTNHSSTAPPYTPPAPSYGEVDGTVVGVTDSLNTALANWPIAIVVGPTRVTGTTDTVGNFHVKNVPLGGGTGIVWITNVPANCDSTSAWSAYANTNPNSAVYVYLTTKCSFSTATVRGTVARDYGGVSAGASVILVSDGDVTLTATTSLNGTFEIDSVPVPPATGAVVAESGSGHCVQGFVRYGGLWGSDTMTVNVTERCDVAGTVTGRVTRSSGGPLIGGQVLVGPPGSDTLIHGGMTDSSGAYSVDDVPVLQGAGTVHVTPLSWGCSDTSVAYDGLTNNDTLVVNAVVSCIPQGDRAARRRDAGHAGRR